MFCSAAGVVDKIPSHVQVVVALHVLLFGSNIWHPALLLVVATVVGNAVSVSPQLMIYKLFSACSVPTRHHTWKHYTCTITTYDHLPEHEKPADLYFKLKILLKKKREHGSRPHQWTSCPSRHRNRRDYWRYHSHKTYFEADLDDLCEIPSIPRGARWDQCAAAADRLGSNMILFRHWIFRCAVTSVLFSNKTRMMVADSFPVNKYYLSVSVYTHNLHISPALKLASS